MMDFLKSATNPAVWGWLVIMFVLGALMGRPMWMWIYEKTPWGKPSD